MSRVLISCYNGLESIKSIPVFYDSLIRVLKRHGNDVVLLNSNLFMDTTPGDVNRLYTHIDRERLLGAITDFAPDLTIAFNNSIPIEILRLAPCPVFVWEADTARYFNNQAWLRDKAGSQYFGAVSDYSGSLLRDAFQAPSARIISLPFATDLRASDRVQEKNISFIGSYFGGVDAVMRGIGERTYADSQKLRGALLRLEADPFDPAVRESLPSDLHKAFDTNTLHNMLSTAYRAEVLSEVEDLGLSLFGNREWKYVGYLSYKLMLCYNPAAISSAAENEDLYNSSKISINISHIQAVEGLPWRIRDVMATSSCLVSDEQKDLAQFSRYVKIPTYANKYDARQICKRLLEDESLRRDIVAGSHAAIEDGNRFEDRLAVLQDIFGTQLLGNGEGSLEVFNPVRFLTQSARVKETLKRQFRRATRLLLPGQTLESRARKIYKAMFRYSRS